MSVNHLEATLLRDTPPFDVLNEFDFAFALENMAAVYLSKQSREDIISAGISLLYLVRSGTYDLVSQDHRRLERLEQGDLFVQKAPAASIDTDLWKNDIDKIESTNVTLQ